MAIMTKEQKDIDDLGPIGIVREAVKVFRSHAKVFLLIQLATMVDLVILLLVVEYLLYQHLPRPDLDPDNNRRLTGLLGVASHIKVPFPGASALHIPVLLVLLATGAGVLVFEVILSLPLAATIYSVGLHYAGQEFVFLDVLRASTPGLWMRLALTNTYMHVLASLLSVLPSLGLQVLIRYWNISLSWLAFYSFVSVGLSLVVSVCLQTIIMVAMSVSVLGEDYGWASMKTSRKLLKGKVKVAILFQLLWFLPAFISVGFQSVLRYQMINTHDYSPWTVALLLFGVVLFIGWTTFQWQFTALCSGIQYVSFKAYHGESLADSLYEKRTTKPGYDNSIGTGSNEFLIGGHLAENTV